MNEVPSWFENMDYTRYRSPTATLINRLDTNKTQAKPAVYDIFDGKQQGTSSRGADDSTVIQVSWASALLAVSSARSFNSISRSSISSPLTGGRPNSEQLIHYRRDSITGGNRGASWSFGRTGTG